MNPYAQYVQPSNSNNPYTAYSAAPVVDEEEQEVISKVNNPLEETPPNFGFVQIPAEVAAGFDQSLLSIPHDVGATLVQAGEVSQSMKGEGVLDVLQSSLEKRLADYIVKNQKPPGLLDFGVPKIIWGAEKDALLSTVSDGETPKMLVSAGNAMMAQNDAALNALGLTPPKNGSIPYDIGTGLGSVMKSIGAAYIAKNPAAAGAYMTWVVNSNDYLEARKAGKDPEQATQLAAISALGQGKIEGIGMGVFQHIASTSGFFKKVLFRAAEQSAEETAQGVVEETVKGASGVRDTSFNEKLHNILYQGALGFVVGAPVSVVYTHMENSAKAYGLDPADIKKQVDAFVKNKEEVVAGAAEMMNREATGITNTTIEQQKVSKAIDSVKTEALQKESAQRANTAIEPIQQQQVNEQQKQIDAIQSETDDIALNALREVTALQEDKNIVDPETHSLLESWSSLLSERRKTSKPLGLVGFLKSIGGITESGGELQFMGMKNRAKDGARNDKTGWNFDDARAAAVEAGYLPADATLSNFLVALEEDFKGYNPIYAEKDIGDQSRLDEIDTILSDIDRGLSDKGIGTDARVKLQELRQRVIQNRKADRAIASVQKKSGAATERLDEQKKEAQENLPKIFADKLKTFISGMRKGGVLQKQETKSVQTALIDMIEESGLDANDRAKFIRTIKNTQTIEQLEARVGEIQEQVAGLVEAANRRDIISKIRNTVAKVKGSNVIAVDFVNQIEGLFNEIDTKKRQPETLASLQKTLDYMQKNPDASMPKGVLKKLEILNKKKLEDITTQELEALSDEIESLMQQGKTKLALMEKKKAHLKEKRIAELQKDSVKISDTDTKRAPIGERLSIMDRIKNRYIEAVNKIKRVGIATNPMDVFFDMLDGDKSYKGANHRIFKQTIDKAFSKYLNLKDGATREVKALTDKLDLDAGSFEKIGAYAVLQQDGGQKKLLDSGFSQEELNGLKLTSDEMQMYQLMRKKLDEMLPAIQNIMRTVYNKDVDGVKDYFPFMTDHEAMKDFEIQDQVGDKVPQIGKKQNVGRGFTESRTLGKQNIRIDALGVFLRHVDNAAYLVEMGKDIKELGEVAVSKEYGEAVGDIGQEMVAEWVNLLARKGSLPGRIAGLDALRRNVGFAVLGFKLSSILIQPTSLADGSALVGGNYVADGIKKVTQKEWRQFLWDNMPEIRDRVGDDAAYLDMGGNTVVSNIREAGFWALKKIDSLAASAVAIGAYTKAVEQKGGTVDLNNPDPEAIAEAQLMMRRTQSSAFAKDTPSLLTQGKLTGSASLDKLLFQFQSFMLNRWSLIKHDMWAAGVKQGKTAQALNIATWLTLAAAAEVGVRRLSKEIVAALSDDELDEWEETIGKESVLTAMGNVPFVSQALNTLEYGSVPVPAIGAATKITNELKWAAQSEDDEDKMRHLISAGILAAGVVGGIPGTIQAEKLFKDFSKE